MVGRAAGRKLPARSRGADRDDHRRPLGVDDRPHRIRIRSDRPRAVASGLLQGEVVLGAQLEHDDTLVVETTTVASFRRCVAEVARDADARLYEVAPLDDDLESVFRYLVER